MEHSPQDLARYIGRCLKWHIFRKGFSIPSFAQKMRVSHPTIKRWVSGKGLSLEDFIHILQVLEIDLLEIALEIDQETKQIYHYTDEQEQAFKKDPLLKTFYGWIWEGHNPQFIAAEKGIPNAQCMKFIFQLEELGLLIWNSVADYKLTSRQKPVSKHD